MTTADPPTADPPGADLAGADPAGDGLPLGRMRTTFMRMMSHELRTPLTSIRGYSELLATGRAGPLSDQQQRMVTMIDLCAGRLHGIVEDLIVIASLDAGVFRLVLEPTRLATVVRRAVEEQSAAARDAGVTVTFDVAADLVVPADPRHLQRALSNLLTNAVTSAPRGGVVGLTAVPTAAEAVTVTIDGPSGGGQPLAGLLGAAPADPAELEGAAIGLAVARAVVDHHGGHLTAAADPHAGTRVTLSLPTSRPVDDTRATVRPQPTGAARR